MDADNPLAGASNVFFVLAIASGILMISGIVYLTRAVDKGEAAQSKS